MAEAARVLDRLPVTRRLFAEQKLSWGHVRGIVARLRRLRMDDLTEVDARVEASLERIDAYSPDELVWAGEPAADEIDGARKVQQREQRRVAANFLAVQPCLDGAVSLYAELDPVVGATVLNALDAASEPPNSEPTTLGEPSSRAKQRAHGLHRICLDWIGGGRGRPARPLAVSSKTRASEVPAEVRLAVGARDRGCRFPGSTTPLRWSDCHHLVPREDNGDHHPDNLVYLVRRWRLLVHRQGWEQHLDPQSGELTISRQESIWRSLPRGTPLSRPPPSQPPDEPERGAAARRR